MPELLLRLTNYFVFLQHENDTPIAGLQRTGCGLPDIGRGKHCE